MSIECPIECVRSACPDPDFLEKHGAWVLTVVGLGAGCIGTVLTYFLKSRCRHIECCGMKLDRDVVQFKDVKTISVTDNA